MSEPTFTEEQVAAMVEKNNRKQLKEIAVLESQLSSRTALINRCAELGIEVEDGDVMAAGQRVLDKLAADRDKLDSDAAARCAEDAAQHEAAIAPIRAETERLTGEINTRRIDYELTTTAQKLGAFNAEQVVTMLRPHTRVLPNGEIIVQNLMPASLQSVSEAVDYLSIDKPNLFTRNVTGRPK